ncbi:MAG: YhcH/YjgK/YiaL family protein [Tannerella sp.]|jgi:YhcH/YjgK/YiaL family protein|nr:YhcH/YjgK/YiaL family protein [Tannerella sp.]
MKKIMQYLFVFVGFATLSCGSKTSKTEKRNDEQINEWFKQSVWNQGLVFKPDESINKRLFFQHHEKKPDRWKKAFDFLNNKNLSELPEGRYELSDEGMYATVSTYETKEPEDARYEAHRKYIDIQYVAEGEEYMEILPLDQMKEKALYDSDKDIIFYNTVTKGELRYADKRHYFVFFPEDVHKPCLKIKTQSTVKKIVVKVPII